MNYLGQAEATAKQLLAAFQSGNLPAAIAPIFIHRNDDVPCRKWSWGNQLLAALAGTADARGFGQWIQVKRAPRKGSKAFYILAPVLKKFEKTDAAGKTTEAMIPVAFKTTPVFRFEDTDGEPVTQHEREFLNALPFRDVAAAWSISVDSYNGHPNAPRGKYVRYQYSNGTQSKAIALGVENLSVWAHELIHAADDKNGKLKEKGQALNSEAVAEFGAAILLECAGLHSDCDLGGCFEYIKGYALAEGKDVVSVAMQVLNRTCEAVALVLDTAATLKPTEKVQAEFTFARVA